MTAAPASPAPPNAPSGWSELCSRQALLVTGKGGVGKTTLAAALARFAARAGKRVLCAEVAAEGVVSSPLALAFGASSFSADEPLAVADGIKGILLTPHAGHRQFLRATLKVRMLADMAMKAAAIRGFLLSAPTFAEMGVLYRFWDLYRQTRKDGQKEHELIVIDLPASGHALAFAQLPAALLKMIPGGPIGAVIRDGLSIITDPAQTAAVVVTLPQSLPVSESLELCRGLSGTGIPVRSVVLNRVCRDPFAGSERALADRLVASHGPLLGGRMLRQIDAAEAAQRRLLGELKLPLLMIEESTQSGADVPVALSRGMNETSQ